MSTQQPPPPGTIRCPRCDATLGPEQDWCLNCGAPARTRLAQRPNWKAPVAVVATLAVLSGVALAIAFVSLTGDDNDNKAPVSTATATTTTPAGTTPAGQPGALTASSTPVTLPTVPTTAPTSTPTVPPSTFTITTPTVTAPSTTTAP